MLAELSSSGSVPDVLSSIVFTSSEDLDFKLTGRSALEKLFLKLWLCVNVDGAFSSMGPPNGCTFFRSTTNTVTLVRWNEAPT